jgi:DNA invertase Pin-like site-specific DNA recombinase
MPIAYAYSRYSSAAQAEGDSLRRQLAGCFEWAEKHGLELDTSLRDHGVSGFTGLNRIRGALGSFLHRVELGQIEDGSYLLVDSMDRLSREKEGEVLHLLTGLTRKGIKVVNVSEDHVLDETADIAVTPVTMYRRG